jgi:hypothetical protein
MPGGRSCLAHQSYAHPTPPSTASAQHGTGPAPPRVPCILLPLVHECQQHSPDLPLIYSLIASAPACLAHATAWLAGLLFPVALSPLPAVNLPLSLLHCFTLMPPVCTRPPLSPSSQNLLQVSASLLSLHVENTRAGVPLGAVPAWLILH